MLSGMRLVPKHLMVKQGKATDWDGVLDLVAGVFEPPCLAKQKGKLQWWGSLSTDGVAASFVYADTRPISKKGTKTAAAAAAVTSSSSNSSSSRSKGTTGATTPALPPPHDLAVVGIDPGRCTIVHAATQVQGTTRTLEWTLPRKRYLLESRLAQAHAKARRWDKAMIGGAWKQMNQQGGALRSSCLQQLTQHIAAYNSVAEEWWTSAMQRKPAKLPFRTYGGRKCCLDRFFSGLERDVSAAEPNKRLAIAYGAAMFSPSGTGKPATPTTAAYRAALRLRSSAAATEP
ncbi:hypothetical protein OEZ86_009398 [Tetradesmus obliquus]|nr:hypothetical protein OEZ86_009398 [Tetradesmus obliquus]